MNTKSSPSRYRYCISRLSTLATSTLTPALKVRSRTLPDSTFFSLVRTKAPPLPGLTCWNSTTVHSSPSRFSVMPFFRSFVVATSRSPRSQDEKFSGGGGQQGRPVGSHDEYVLDADSALAGQVDARLDGDGNPAGKLTRSAVPDQRRLVHLEADAVAEAVLEMLAVPGVTDHVPGGGVHVRDVGTRPGGLDAGPLRGRDKLVDLALPACGLAERDGAGHVRVVAAVGGAEVHRDQVAAAQRPVGRGVMRDGAVGPAGHDRVERGPVRAERGHPRIQRRVQRALGHAGPDQREGVGERLGADPARRGEQLELARVLDRP